MSTFATRLAGDRKKLALWFTIQGIERVFKERPSVDASSILGETRAESACIPMGGIEHGETRIDFKLLSQVGGGMRARLVQPRRSTILEDIFQHRARKVAFLTTTITKTSTSISISSTTGLGIVGAVVTFYMGSETIQGTIASTTSITGCTRAMFGSRAQIHEGTSTDGTAVFAVPPAFLGRRITLYGSFLNDNGTTNAAKTTRLGTFTIERNPSMQDDAWVIEAGPVIDEYMNRSCYVGIQEVDATEVYRASAADEDLTVRVSDAIQFVTSIHQETYAMLRTKDGVGITGKVTSFDATFQLITLRPVDFLSPRVVVGVGHGPVEIESARHFAMIMGADGAVILQVLCSNLGDLANGIYDVLPGRDRSSFTFQTWRFGAAIDEADIDDASFNEVPAGFFWSYILDRTTKVGDIVREWAIVAEAFIYENASGQLAAAYAGDTSGAAVLTIDRTLLIATQPPLLYPDEESVFPIVTLKANYSPLIDDFEYRESHIDAELLQRYAQRDEATVFELKGVGVDVGATNGVLQHFVRSHPKTPGEMQDLGRRLQRSGGPARLIAEVPCKLAALVANLGDLVTLDFDATDFAGGTVRGRKARVVGKRPNYDAGVCVLTVHIVEPVFVFAPSAVVTAVATTSIANDTITLSTTTADLDDATPTDNFAVGMKVRVFDVSAGTSQELEIAAIPSATQIRLTAGVAGAVETGRDFISWSTLGTNAALTSGSGLTEADLAYQMPDSGVPASGDVRRWR